MIPVHHIDQQLRERHYHSAPTMEPTDGIAWASAISKVQPT